MQIKQKMCAGWDSKPHSAFIWKNIEGKPYCKVCTTKLEPQKAFVKAGINKISEKQKEKNKVKKQDTAILHKTMFEWWKSFGGIKTCENCGLRLPNEFSTINVHHLLPKHKFKNQALNTNYYMLLCQDCHTGFEVFPNKKHESIYNRTKIALKDYEQKTKRDNSKII